MRVVADDGCEGIAVRRDGGSDRLGRESANSQINGGIAVLLFASNPAASGCF